ncbi:uncharacterized protein BP5553_05776 [Venustampulla echinocandica]|uniref:Copper homeostasis protein cutC homolog n=1 Tax=Venustampulla echinocandica TaxID=2656787 RepID=A0A370TLM5_9HELO|nr:uncharacterized protein BP5553_05776 [Venustampulla echinocandica]RDL36424.1 hypothetical protein BP5553_05776 [Venustampulla echinocandica]
MAPLLEIAAFNAPSALRAATSGASRIELCTSLQDGGLTPSLETYQTLTSSLPSSTGNPAIPIHIMIRPHPHSFTYTASELEKMSDSIRIFSEKGAAAFVLGVLDGRGLVDVEANRTLISAAAGRPCTFHRAFDEIPPENMEDQLEILIALGFEAVLTSGGKRTAWDGRDVLSGLVRRAEGRICVILGGGVRSEGLQALREVVCRNDSGDRHVVWHSSAILEGGGEMCSEEEVRRLRRVLDC